MAPLCDATTTTTGTSEPAPCVDYVPTMLVGSQAETIVLTCAVVAIAAGSLVGGILVRGRVS